MPVFTYVAKRELITGHTVDTVYDLEYGLLVLDRSRDTKKSESIALDGSQETILHRQKTVFSVMTRCDATTILQWREFIASIDGGEAFVFDEFGTIAVPDNGINCRLVGKTRERRIQKMNKYDCSWQFRVV